MVFILKANRKKSAVERLYFSFINLKGQHHATCITFAGVKCMRVAGGMLYDLMLFIAKGNRIVNIFSKPVGEDGMSGDEQII